MWITSLFIYKMVQSLYVLIVQIINERIVKENESDGTYGTTYGMYVSLEW